MALEESANESLLAPSLAALVGKRIWCVSGGGAAGNSFSLAIGEKVPREYPIERAGDQDDFCTFRGEFMLYVWCSWRLEIADELASSDQSFEISAHLVRQMVGRTIEAVSTSGRVHDLKLVLEEGASLNVFCDHVPPEFSFDGNWELVFPGGAVYVGPGTKVETDTSKQRQA